MGAYENCWENGPTTGLLFGSQYEGRDNRASRCDRMKNRCNLLFFYSTNPTSSAGWLMGCPVSRVLSAWRLQYSKCGPLKQLSLEFLMTKMPSAYSQVTKWPRLTNRPNVEENWRHVLIDNIINVSPYLQHYFIMKRLKPKLDGVVKIRPTRLNLSSRIFN